MLQSYVAWYQLISSHPASCIAVCWRLDDPDPFPQGPPIPQGGGLSLFYLYPKSILLFLRDLIWSAFQYLIWTYILVTYFSIHACLAWNQLSSSYFSIHACLAWNQHSSSYPTNYIAVGWRLDDSTPSQGPPIPQGGRGGLMGYDHDHGRGGGGGPGTWNIYTVYTMTQVCHTKPQGWHATLSPRKRARSDKKSMPATLTQSPPSRHAKPW